TSPRRNDAMKFTSTGAGLLLHHCLDETLARVADKTALVCDGSRVSYADLSARADRMARALHERGVRRGDRGALFLDNSGEMVAGIFAALRLGAVFMPINAMTKHDKLAYMLNDSGASALIGHALLARIWKPALAESPSVHTCLVMGAAGGDQLPEHCLAYADT